MTDPLDALRSSSEHLRQLSGGLKAPQLDEPAYPSEWSIADVFSHLGSGAVISERRLEDALAGRDTPAEFSQSVWDDWNAKSSSAKAADAIVADQNLVRRFELVTDVEKKDFQFVMGPIRQDFTGLVGMRLNEHVLHTWDIDVALDPSASLSPEGTDFIIDRLELIARYTGKPLEIERLLSIRTTDPRRDFTLTAGPETVLLTPAGSDSEPDLVMPAEALIRLIYGRLDSEHTPSLVGGEHLEMLRRMFSGL